VAHGYDLPAVMGTGRATTALPDGQIVTVDGDRGRGDADVDGGVGDAQPTADGSRDETRAMYDRIAGIYQVVEGAWERAAIMRGLMLLDARPGESVLEVGCGPGAALVRLAHAVQPGGRAVGVDLSPRMCRIARRRIRRAHLTTVASVDTCDATRLPFPAGSFDACLMSFTLELSATPQIPTVLAEIARVLRAGGRIVVVALTKDGPDRRGRRVYEWGHQQLPRLLDCRPIHLSSILARAGFQATTTQRMSLWGLPVDAVVAVVRGNVNTDPAV
jgi:ubiquinone/menaquinone biosynthesis C-methylase UbiE